MYHQEFGAERQRPLQFAAKSGNRLGVKLGITARKVDQVVSMDRQRLEVIALAQAAHFGTLRPCKPIGFPLSRAGRKNLEGIASESISALGAGLDTAGGGGVNADAA